MAGLGDTLRGLGSALNPQVLQGMQREDLLRQQQQNAMQQGLLGQIVKGVESGSIDPSKLPPELQGLVGPSAETQLKQNQLKMFQGAGSADMQDPAFLRRMGLALGKPELITHAERIDKDRAQTEELKTYRTSDTNPGLFSTLMQSDNPYISNEAKQLQAQLDKSGDVIPPTVWSTRHAALAAAEARFQEMKASKELDPATIATNAKAIAEYKQAPLQGFSMRSPGAQETMRKVMEINPDYNAQNYAISLKTRNAFSTGVEGRTTRAFNVAIDHLDTLNDAADALKNNNVKRFNQLAQRIAEETGSSTPTNFDAIKGIVAKEIVKSVVGNASAGGQQERQELAVELSRSNSPAQLSGMIGRYQTLMAGQLKGLKKQYESGYGGDDFETRFLLPRSREIYQKMQQGTSVPGGWKDL